MSKTNLNEEIATKNGSEKQKTSTFNMRILAENHFRDNNTWVTGLNNNDLIIGPSGAGKTRSYVIPNVLNAENSLIVADTKGNLCRLLSPALKKKGYKVIEINFKNMTENNSGYNPFDFIGYDKESGEYVAQDIMKVVRAITPIQDFNQPFWEHAARDYIECLVGYVLESLPEEERNLSYVRKMADYMGTQEFDALFLETLTKNPDGFVAQRYKHIQATKDADKMQASIRSIVFEKLLPFSFKEAKNMFTAENRISFSKIGEEKTAVFLNISDTDRSLDSLVSLFYAQAFQELCKKADSNKDSRLKVPVHFIMDDFATNTFIEGFDNIISVIRSREISVSLIVQSLSQLEALYGENKSATIMNNCDNCLYLGGTDVKTASYFAVKLNKTIQNVLNMPLNQAILFTRGQSAEYVEKYDFSHCENMVLFEGEDQDDKNESGNAYEA